MRKIFKNYKSRKQLLKENAMLRSNLRMNMWKDNAIKCDTFKSQVGQLLEGDMSIEDVKLRLAQELGEQLLEHDCILWETEDTEHNRAIKVSTGTIWAVKERT